MGKFKVGDRVRLKRINGNERWGKQGEEGTVLVDDDGCNDCRVKFDSSGEWYAVWSDLEHVTPAAAARALTIEAGKYYKTRDGRKVGPLTLQDDDVYPFLDAGPCESYRTDGTWSLVGENHPNDIVSEWIDEPAVLVEAGKSYLDTKDNVIGPMFTLHEGFFAAVRGNGQSWRSDGSVYGKSGNPNPLVREYKREATTASPTPRTTYLPEPGDRVLIEASVTGATTSRKGAHYNVTLTTVGGKKVSLHFLAEDLIILPDEPMAAVNDNGRLPFGGDTAKAFDDLRDSIFGLTVRAR